jgi:hypothetical protein
MYMLQDVTKSAGAGTSFTQELSDESSSLVLFLVNTSWVSKQRQDNFLHT